MNPVAVTVGLWMIVVTIICATLGILAWFWHLFSRRSYDESASWKAGVTLLIIITIAKFLGGGH